MRKFLQTLTGALMLTLGLTMTIFAWVYFFTDDGGMIVLASLYVALTISVVITIIGLTFIVGKDRNK